MRKPRVNRRTLLKGIVGGSVVSVALPPLECMFNSNATAYADGGELIKRFGVWYFGGGVRDDGGGERDFLPGGSGTNWTPSFQTEPLADPAIKPYVNIITNLNTGYGDGEATVHNLNHAVALAGTGNVGPRIGAGVTNSPSIDNLVRQRFSEQGLRAANGEDQLGVACSFGGYAGQSSFVGGAGEGFVSMESNPQQVFDRLFGPDRMLPEGGGGVPIAASPRQKSKEFVVDVVKAEAESLRAKLGSTDRQRLDQHLEGILALQRRIQRFNSGELGGGQGCSRPGRPTITGSQIDNPLQYNGDEKGTGQSPATSHAIMSDLMVMALACDITRVFSMEFIATQSNVIFQDIPGVTEAHHLGLAHGRSVKLRDTTRHILAQLAEFLKKLRNVTEGDKTLLDNVAIYTTSESRDGNAHSLSKHFAITSGLAGGALKGGQYIDAQENGQLSSVMYTLAHAVGADISGVGKSGARGYSNQHFGAIKNF